MGNEGDLKGSVTTKSGCYILSCVKRYKKHVDAKSNSHRVQIFPFNLRALVALVRGGGVRNDGELKVRVCFACPTHG